MALPSCCCPPWVTLLLLASVVPTYLGDEAIKKNNQRGLIINLVVTIILEVGFLGLIITHMLALNYAWQENAYASAYWTLVVTHLVFAAVTVLESLYILVLA